MDTPTPLLCTAYLPQIAYMALLAQHPQVTIEQYETFHKQTLRNRTVIATANGLLPLSVPVTKPNGNHTMTGDMLVNYREHWPAIHWRAITSAYSGTPFFLYYKDAFEAILLRKHDTLLELNNELLAVLMKAFRISCTVRLSQDFAKVEKAPGDYRAAFSIKRSFDDISFPEYNQVFADRLGFQPNVSALDLLFNLGPDSAAYLTSLKIDRILTSQE
jgi:hypothetical protein